MKISFLLIFLVTWNSTSYGGVLAFRETLKQICSPTSTILEKKILLELSGVRLDSISIDRCNENLEELVKKCSKELPCSTLLRVYDRFLTNNTSNLIGE